MSASNSVDGDVSELGLRRASAHAGAPRCRLLAAQPRLRSLMDEGQLVTGDLDLARVLRQIAESAISLVDAQYGALGVLAPDGGLEQFIHVGMTEELVEQIGHLPEGHGVLGAVVESSCPIRLTNLNEDSRAVGFPERHPPMNSFLGVPITIRGEVFGNLYLTNRAGGPFTEEDEELMTVLAVTAATAISNARRYGEARRAQQLSSALSEVSSALLSSPTTDAFGVLAQSVASLTGAQLVSVVVSETVGGELYVDTARGDGASSIEGTTMPWVDCVLSRAMKGEPGISHVGGGEKVPFIGDVPSASMIAVPLAVSGDGVAALCATRSSKETPFTSDALALLSEFATQAGLALAFAWAREDHQRLEVVEERARIARDLHDHVIQRLFATGMGLQALAATYPKHAAHIESHVAEIDAAIGDIRTAIFALQPPTPSLTTRHRLLEVMSELAPRLSTIPRMTFVGSVDLIMDSTFADDAVAVLRELLTNVARHAHADNVEVEISVSGSLISITVDDDGVGLPAHSTRSSGVKNLSARARAHNGTFELASRSSGGTRARWQVPIDSPALL